MPASPSTRPTAKEGFSSLDTLALVREIRALGRCWFDKAFSLPGDRVLVSLKAQDRGKWDLLVAPGRFATLLPSSRERPEEPGRLGKDLRQHLTGAPLLSVEQPEGERYLELSFGRGGEETPAVLAFELFGQGNVLLVRRGKIMALLHARAWAGRQLRAGRPYVRPPARKDPFRLSAGEVMAALVRSRTDRVSTLAARLGMGGPVAEEVLARAGLEERVPATSEAEPSAERIVQAMGSLLGDIADPPQGHLLRSPDLPAPLDATPFPSRRWGSVPGVSLEAFARFSEAAAVYFAELPAPAAPVPGAKPTEADLVAEERATLLRLRAQQTAAVEELTRAMSDEQGTAQLLLTRYEEAEGRLEQARSAAPDEVEVEISLEGRAIRLPGWRPLRESAQALFDQAKRRLPKLEGARHALTETERKLAALEEAQAATEAQGRSERVEAEQRAVLRPWATPRRKHFWFERAPRWMVSSEGWVAVAGRDAKSNDAVVKRYLREHDLYFHADLQGAPSVVLKRSVPGQGDVGERTLREVAQWGVACSKAWRAGLASADAFWVEGENVSKAGASGEFVARGSWVIHGTKHFEKDLPLELALGTLEHEGELLLQVAPPESFQGERRKVLWRVLPGDERERDEVERKVAQDLGVSRERLQALFPPGGVRAVRP
ncbi:MAG: NFACT family protein [Euryarchaeota archaeon]|nr:NFACT family protein [Euryarchaeota archaeon]MDE1835439.1 NFACT family protein [Euryarchaeota archaeon]MDE1879575.1 NFACT family protein [Euryarchaeota archaeon]MDE2046090.1 NFACT family protein [Thermoplasmata archaeon]